MRIEIWIPEESLESLINLVDSWFSSIDSLDQSVRYLTKPPIHHEDWICVALYQDDFIALKEHGLLVRETRIKT